MGIIIFCSCSWITPKWMGASEKSLIKTVALQQNCDISKIKIIGKIRGANGAEYKIEACDKRFVSKKWVLYLLKLLGQTTC